MAPYFCSLCYILILELVDKFFQCLYTFRCVICEFVIVIGYINHIYCLLGNITYTGNGFINNAIDVTHRLGKKF